jgi:hypothetical protein
MANFGFWNVNSLWDLETNLGVIPGLAAELAEERSLDVLFLIECAIPVESLMAAFRGRSNYYSIPCGKRFKVLATFNPKFMQLLELPVPDDRFDIWHLTLPLQEDVLLSVVHGPDKRNNSLEKQGLFMQQVVAALSYCERKIGHDRSIVLGDFNANPFEPPVTSVFGMNAVVSQAIAQGGPRLIRKRSYPYFYNPMWNLLGDPGRGSAPGTYYYRGSDTNELYWHMLDQVVIRPTLLKRFDVSNLDIITAVGTRQLTRANGTPDSARFSDHLPVVFGVDLSAKDDKGDKYVYKPVAGLRQPESAAISESHN